MIPNQRQVTFAFTKAVLFPGDAQNKPASLFLLLRVNTLQPLKRHRPQSGLVYYKRRLRQKSYTFQPWHPKHQHLLPSSAKIKAPFGVWKIHYSISEPVISTCDITSSRITRRRTRSACSTSSHQTNFLTYSPSLCRHPLSPTYEEELASEHYWRNKRTVFEGECKVKSKPASHLFPFGHQSGVTV